MKPMKLYILGKTVSEVKGMSVYRNDTLCGFIPSRSKAEAKKWVKNNVLFTHMGEWRKFKQDEKHLAAWEYATTAGAYYRFLPDTRIAEVFEVLHD